MAMCGVSDLGQWLEDAGRPRARQPGSARGYEQHPDYGGRPPGPLAMTVAGIGATAAVALVFWLTA